MSALPSTVTVQAGLSDERLAARVASDPTAFAELHGRYEQPLLRYSRSLLRDPHDVADAAQDAWTRAFAALRESPPRVLCVRSWLFAITRNACMDRVRDGRRCMPADIDERSLGASPAPDDVLELRARAREALRDLAALSERQRTAVVLRDLKGIEGDELARALNTDARRVSWLLTDARRSLAEVRSGRGVSCETARRQLDTARVRTRALRAHLAACPQCDGYARRRVAARLHLHGVALLVLALPARLRALWPGGLGAAKPVGAIVAATLVAVVPAVHELGGSGARDARHAATAPTPRRAAAAPAVRLPAAPFGRRRVQARAVVTLRGSTHSVARHQAAPPERHRSSAGVVSSPPATAPIVSHALAGHVHATVVRVAGTVTDVVPAAAPVVQAATGTVGMLPADL